jgi:glyoxylase-like metal-dependent hydrolase (beta-lactamase superfamily II)
MELRVISIGALSANPLWNEKGAVRTGHATCSLIRTGKKVIIVDPGLPPAIIAARLNERSGLRAADITHVFLTTFKPETMRGVMAFEKATWMISQDEREGTGVPLVGALQKAAVDGDDELKKHLEQDVAVLRRCEAAPDRLGEGVDLFPLPGVTPGCCGLLCQTPRTTTLICGDAIPTMEHLERGQVLQSASDVMRARESFGEAVEIADFLVLGRDNLAPSPVKRPF